MKVTLAVAQLQEVMDLMARFVSKHATLPILENVYIKGSIDSIIFRATDMEKYVEVELPASLDDEGAITVNANTLSAILRNLDETQVVLVIEESKDLMIIQTASDEFKIKGIPASEYVAVPEVQTESPITLSADQFSLGIGKVEYAVTEKNFSPVLTGILMRIKKYEGAPKLVFVGTDSFRLAEYKLDVDQKDVAEFAIIVPKVHINDIKRVVDFYRDKGGSHVHAHVSNTMVSFGLVLKDMKISCTCLLIQGSFPEYENENIMPTTFSTKVVLDKNQLDKAIKRILIMTKDINNYIAVRSQDDKLMLSSGETDMGEAQTSTPALVDGEQVQFGVNGKYIADFLRIVTSTEITMQLLNAEKPIIFKDKDDAHYTYVVRPLIK